MNNDLNKLKNLTNQFYCHIRANSFKIYTLFFTKRKKKSPTARLHKLITGHKSLPIRPSTRQDI